MAKNTAQRVQKYRNNLRSSGFRLIQIWILDTRKKGFKKECKRQAELLKNDPHEKEILNWLDKIRDVEGWE